jgi:thiol-disulfide isomerase/thioredoxin
MSSLLKTVTPQSIGSLITTGLEWVWSSMTWHVVLGLFLLSIVFFIGVFMLFKKYGPKIKFIERFTTNGENTSSDDIGDKQAELIFFTVDWCPHCKSAKPEWNDLIAQHEGKQINGYTVNFREYDCTNETDEINRLIATYKIEGYPTIKLLKDGEVIEYDAKPKKDTLSQFLQSVL